MSDDNVTGYRPGMFPNRTSFFNSDKDDFELWEMKFKAHLRLNKLHKILKEEPTEATQATYDESNQDIFSLLVMSLDDKALNLIMRDAENDGKKALKILREHYLGTSKPRVISLYCELTSLKMKSTESVVEYLIRAETASSHLKQAKETVSDSLLIAMVIKGLPERYRSFNTVISQKDSEELDFQKFKVALRTYDENEKAREAHYSETSDNVLSVENKNSAGKQIVCFNCNCKGHKSFECTKPKVNKANKSGKRKWCENCRSPTHNSVDCRKKTESSKSVSDNLDPNNENYIFQVSNFNHVNEFDVDPDSFLVDCGATCHIVCDRQKFINIDENFDCTNHTIELADATRQKGVVVCKGDAKIQLQDANGRPCNVILSNALCIPSFKQDIISVHALTRQNIRVVFEKNSAKMITKDGTIFNIELHGKLYYVNSVTDKFSKARSLESWHSIMGHCNRKDILSLESAVDGMKISDKSPFDCSTCLQGKMVETRNHNADAKATKRLELVHTDLSGCVTPTSFENSKYCINFVDDYSGLITVYFLKNKSDAAKATARFIADMAPYGKIERLRCDNGTEYTGSEFRELMTANKIKQEFSAPYSPHQNGTSERSWRSIFDMSRCMLLESGLPKELWNYSTRYASFIRNRCFNNRLKVTAFEAFTSKKPNLGKIEPFGSTCYAYVQDKKKLDDRSREGKFIGFDPLSPAYIVYFPDKGDVKRVRTVKFLQNRGQQAATGADKFEQKRRQEAATSPDTFRQNGRQEAATSADTFEQNKGQEAVTGDDMFDQVYPQFIIPVTEAKGETENKPAAVAIENGVESAGATEPPAAQPIEPTADESRSDNASKRYPQREKKKPAKFDEYITSENSSDDYDSASTTVDYFCKISNIPLTYKEAVTSPQRGKWHTAMLEELKALQDNDTFTLVPKEGRDTIGGRWVFSTKIGKNNEDIFKARYVAKGYSQIHEINYDETFSPTAKMTSVRILMDLCVRENLFIHQMDVRNAYLNSKIDYEIFVDQPPGFITHGKNGEELVLKLNKSLYGLKQSGRLWNEMLDNFLCNLKFERSHNDYCVYTRSEKGIKTIILIWVDDVLIASSDLASINEIKSKLSEKFRMKDFGQISYFLGIEFEIAHDFIKMHQSKFICKLLDKFGMNDCNKKLIPCDGDAFKTAYSDSSFLEDKQKYQEIVGSLIYLMTGTRPDICYVVTKLSERMSNPTQAHLNLAKSVLRYLKGTIDKGIVYRKVNEPIELVGYSDSDWGSSDDRKSITGYCFKLSKNSTLVSWCSRKQPTVSLSTCESEYQAVTTTVQEAIFLKQLLSCVLKSDIPTVYIFCDNKGTIDLAKNPVHHKRTKHIDIRFHFIREHIRNGVIKLDYIPSGENIADMFTKPVSKGNLLKFGVVS